MTVVVSRTDKSVVGRWWWTVDRWMLLALAMLIGVGCILALAASPAVAYRLNFDQFHFVERQIVFVALALGLMFSVSLLSPIWVRRAAALIFVASLVLTVLTLVFGPEVHGARRWLYLGGLSLQPSEFLKPSFAILTAWMFSEARQSADFPGERISIVVFAIAIIALLMQPDVGMALVVAAVWFAQYFVAGLSVVLVALLVFLGLAGGVAMYALFPHVRIRIDRFFDPGAGNYQIDQAMDAFALGGLFGRGPGQGAVKSRLPDAHTDFVFAVAGEEFGLLVCLFIVGLFAFVVLRGFARLMAEENLFVMLAASGLLTQFGLQAVINMGVNLSLLPTKGMTLPFISYGGSSMLALGLGMGMLLALTRQRPRFGVIA